MKVLGIDTSTESLGIAIVEDGKLIVSNDKISAMRHSQDLIPTIKDLLKRASLALGDIDGIAVSIGPGSFTGLRIGVTTAKTLSLVTGKPVAAVPTLDAIARNAYYYPGTICPIMDAKKQLVYAALYKRSKKGLKRTSRHLLISVEELLKKLDTKTLFLGDGIGLYGGIIEKVKKAKAEFAPPWLWLPKAEQVALLGSEKLKRSKKEKPLELVPLYLHSKECNIRR